MIWMIVCAVLASAGLLLIVWVLLGWCVLPPRREAVTIYRLSASEPQLSDKCGRSSGRAKADLRAGV